MKMESELTQKQDKTQLDKEILKTMQFVHPYVKHRIYVAENQNYFRKNLYQSNDLVDEVVIDFYEQNSKSAVDLANVKIELFKQTIQKLDQIFLEESRKAETDSVEWVLEDQLITPEVEFYGSADLDALLKEDFDDISYKQPDVIDGDIFSNENDNRHLLESMDIHIESFHDCCSTVKQFYDWLPDKLANVIDLRSFAKLNPSEIADVLNVEEKQVIEVLSSVPQHFKHNH